MYSVKFKRLSDYSEYARVEELLKTLCNECTFDGSATEFLALIYEGKLYPLNRFTSSVNLQLSKLSPLHYGLQELKEIAREEAKKVKVVREWRFVPAKLSNGVREVNIHVYIRCGGIFLHSFRINTYARDVSGVNLRLFQFKHRCFSGLNQRFGWFKQMNEYWPAVENLTLFGTVYTPWPTQTIVSTNCQECTSLLQKLKEVGAVA